MSNSFSTLREVDKYRTYSPEANDDKEEENDATFDEESCVESIGKKDGINAFI
jgi:hypothetical protein